MFENGHKLVLILADDILYLFEYNMQNLYWFSIKNWGCAVYTNIATKYQIKFTQKGFKLWRLYPLCHILSNTYVHSC